MEENQEGNQVLFLKVSLYLMSLWILMFMLLVLKVDVSCFSFKMTKEDVIYSLRHNVIPLMCIGLSLLGGESGIFILKIAWRMPRACRMKLQSVKVQIMRICHFWLLILFRWSVFRWKMNGRFLCCLV